MAAFITLPPTPTPPTPPALTKAQKIQRANAIIVGTGQGILSQMKSYSEATLKAVWQNPDFSAQDYFDALGTKAGDAMADHAGLLVYLATHGVTVDTSMVKAYTVNGDGTVTVTGA